MPSERDTPRPFRAAGGPALLALAGPDDKSEDGKPKLGTFTGVAYTGAAMKPGGWWLPIIVDLKGVKVPSQHRPIFFNHDPDQIVGHTDTVTVSSGAAGTIAIAGLFSGQPEHVEKVTVPAGNKFQWQLSIGADPIRTEWLEAGETTEVNGREVTGPMTISRETELSEISFVPLGADGDTSADVSASRGRSPMYEKNMLKAARANGNLKAGKYSDADIDQMTDDEAKAALKKCMKAEDDDADAKAKAKAAADDEEKKTTEARTAEGIKAARKAWADEDRRCTGIRAAVKKHGVTHIEIVAETGAKQKVDLAAHAIEQGWSEDKVELHALRAARPTTGPHVYSTTQPEVSADVLEAAVLQAAGCELFHEEFMTGKRGDREGMHPRDRRIIKAEMAKYDDKVQQYAHTLFKGRIGLQQMLTLIARGGGYKGPDAITTGNLGEVAAACMRIEADGTSTITVQNVTANVQNKFLLQGYMYTEQAWKEVAAIKSVKDFKPTKSVNLFGDVEFKDIPPSGEIDNASLQDQAFANSVKSRGRMVTIPRTLIINDDLGAFGQVPMIMGRGAGLKLNSVFWARFLSPGLDDGGSTNFWAAVHTLLNGQVGNSNLSSGAGSALSSGGLTAATLLFDNQVDPVGYPLGLDAEVLLYPPDLQTTALELMNSEWIVQAAGATTKQPSNNIWKGRYRPVKSRYLNKAAFTGNSTIAWYLLANPSILPVIEVAFLNGQEMPTVQQAGPDFQFNYLGISTRAFFDMDANMQNFRGGVKSAGS